MLPYLQQFYLSILEIPIPEFSLPPQLSPFLESILQKRAW